MEKKSLFAFSIVFIGGLFAGYVGHGLVESTRQKSEEQNASRQIRQMGEYRFINPLLECEVADGLLDARKENFHDELAEYIATLKHEKNLSEVAVYFRDLNNGPTFGDGEQQEFLPASLLKVPVMMGYFHLAEQDKSVLEFTIPYVAPKDFGITPTIFPREAIVPGETYTVEELIRRMIVFSDNQALALLTERLPLSVLQNLFSMLGVGEDVLIKADSKLTVKEYAGFFRILFNSSYLSREYSEKALSLLSKTDFHDALPAGVGPGVVVAHKFGEAGTGEIDRQLHDCGIVYFPDHPYLVCIMTRGQETAALKETIQDISHFIYEKIDEQY